MKCPKCHSENPDGTRFCGNCAASLPSSEQIPVSHTKTFETPLSGLTRGSTFAGRYEIIEELGKGGMGQVYKAFDHKVKEEVALKLLKPEIASDEKTIERFSNELKFARKIVHKNVGRMFDLNEEAGTHYITMEYVPGEDLKSFIVRSRQLAVGTAVSIAKQVCEGLAEAHKLGLVHRDMKPQNIMIDKQGNARIMDFGIARSIKANGITGPGVMIGTPEYMSPEQVEGKGTDQRSDIYSLGVILYEMVSGRVPFEGDTPISIALKHKAELPESPQKYNAQVSDALSQVILRCMEKDKEQRYQTAAELLSDLTKIEEGIPITQKIIPKRKPLTSKEITVTFGLKKLLIPVIVVLIIAVVAVFLFRKPAPKIDPDMVVVAIFENQTGDESLDSLGRLVADWVTQGLSQTGVVKIVPTMTVMQSTWMRSIKAGTLQGKDQFRALAEETGAGRLVSGAYYLADEELQIHASITDVLQGRLIHSFEPLKGPLEKRMEVIEELRQRIMGALATDIERIIAESWQGVHVPKYEAYLEFLSGMEHFGLDYAKALSHFEKAIEMDPKFMAPRIRIGSIYSNLGQYDKSEAIYRYLNENRDKLTPIERHLLDWAKASLQGKNAESLQYLRQAEKLTPKDPIILYLIGHTGIKINDPRMTVETLTEASYPETWYRYVIPTTWWFGRLADAFHVLGDFKEELKVIKQYRVHYPDVLRMRANEVRALAAMGKLEKVQRVIEESMLIRSQLGTAGDVMLAAAKELRTQGFMENYKETADRAVDWYKSKMQEDNATENQRYDLAEALYEAGRWEEARPIFKRLAEENPDKIEYTGYRGTLAARRGDREEALRTSERIKHMERPYLFGRHTLWRARINALLGEKAQAVSLLRESFSQGLRYGVYLLQAEDLDPLRDYPPFRELMEPKS